MNHKWRPSPSRVSSFMHECENCGARIRYEVPHKHAILYRSRYLFVGDDLIYSTVRSHETGDIGLSCDQIALQKIMVNRMSSKSSRLIK